MLTGNLFRSIRNRCPVSQINRRLKLSDSLCSHLNNTHGKLRNLFTICILAIQRPHHFSGVICMESLKKSASLCRLFQLSTVIQKSVGLVYLFILLLLLFQKPKDLSLQETLPDIARCYRSDCHIRVPQGFNRKSVHFVYSVGKGQQFINFSISSPTLPSLSILKYFYSLQHYDRFKTKAET